MRPRRNILVTTLLAGALGLTGCGGGATPSTGLASPTAVSAPSTSAATRVMADEIGNVTVPAEAKRIATTAPAYTTSVLLLGGADKLVALEENYGKNAWIKQKYPQLANRPVVFSANQTNMEALLGTEPDLVIYASRYGPGTLKQLQDLKIAAISGAKDASKPGYDHLNWVRDNQLYLGEAIGGGQLETAKTYGKEFTAIRTSIAAKTTPLPKDKRPTVVQLSAAGQTLQANNGSAIGQELIELAGGTNAAKDAAGQSMGPSGQTQIEPEQLLKWNPEILLVDSPAIRDKIASDPVFAGLKAVSTNRVYVIPNGAMAWAYNGPEEYLAMQFFAKAVHPELFGGIDMEVETVSFYQNYFGFTVSSTDLAYLFALSGGKSVADVFGR